MFFLRAAGVASVTFLACSMGGCVAKTPRPAVTARTDPAAIPYHEVESGADALSVLKIGNARFSSGHAAHPHSDARFRQQLEKGQRPLATILGCSDSRVPPELIFDEGFGDLFVVRVAGNIVDVDVAASVEYAVDHLHSPLLVVLGHEHCGAVSAAVQHLRGALPSDKEPPEVFSLLAHIEEGLKHFPPAHDLDELVRVAVEDNVRHSVDELMKTADIQSAVQAHRLEVVGAIYDLHTGRVRFLGE